MTENTKIDKTTVNVASEYGHLNAVLLHRPGIEIERMTPGNAGEALFSDILSKHIVDKEYAAFSGVLEKWCKVYYVEDLLTQLMDNDDVRQYLVAQSCKLDDCEFLADQLMEHDSRQLARELIEGVPYHADTDPQRFELSRFSMKPLYNLFFTRDASSSVYDEVLINSMSFAVRQRETLIYRVIFEYFFSTKTFCGLDADSGARTEGGDVQVASPNLLCIGEGIRTNRKGIMYLAEKFAKERPKFNILVQELPHKPDSFIHLDMVHTFLGSHQLMVYPPLLDKTGLFAGKSTTRIVCDNGNISTEEYPNMLEGLNACGMEMEPVLCGGFDTWYQDREQWHSGANFFALGDGKVIGYERNERTIDALAHAGFAVLDADDVCSGKVEMKNYDKFVVAFKASELPRAGGGARCMTMPINRD
ncbi:MAG: arginine deiminase [Bacteroidales bacterium]|nr:arginine deiminase [Bacteroidales bacterium]